MSVEWAARVSLPLAEEVRARLRSDVDVAALEQLLADLPHSGRWLWVHRVLAAPTPADAAALGRPAGATDVITPEPTSEPKSVIPAAPDYSLCRQGTRLPQHLALHQGQPAL